MELHIAIVPEKITEWLGIPITNTLITSWVVMAALIVFALFVSRSLRAKPGKAQNAVEAIFEYLLDFMEETLGNRKLAMMYMSIMILLLLYVK